MNLHYSQTNVSEAVDGTAFDYHMNLHYSQTHTARLYQPLSLTTI